MKGLWIKLVVCPLIVLFVDYISIDVFYSSWFSAIVVGLVLAVISYLMDMMILKPGTLWISTILDFFVSAVLIFFSQFFTFNTYISLTGALLIASFLAISEYLVHRWMIQSGQTTNVQPNEP